MGNRKLMSDNIISFKNIYKFYNSKLVLENINFDIKKNSLTTIIGPNGGGKTTIARLIIDAIKPSRGQIFKDKDLKIGYVPQRNNLSKTIPIDIEHFIKLIADSELTKKQIKEIISISGIEVVKHKQISSLSGGQFQRLIIAATIYNKPDLLIFDEPTQALDIAGQKEFYQIISDYRKKYNITILTISHDINMVMNSSDQIICLDKHLCCSGKPSDVAENHAYLNLFSNNFSQTLPHTN